MELIFVRETTLNNNQLMKTDADTKSPDRFNHQQNTDDNRNNQYEERNGKAFTCYYRMNLPRIAKFVTNTNWDEVT